MATTKDVVTCKFEGVVKSAYSKIDKDENGNTKTVTNIITLLRDGLTVDGSAKVKEFFDGLYKNVTAPKFIPSWYKEDKDFIVLKSAYNVPCKLDETGEHLSFAEFVDRGNINGAQVIVKCNVKPSTVYPSAMLIKVEGEPYDAFKDF